MRQMVRLAEVVAIGMMLVVAGTAFAQPGDSNLGTWKRNIAKSKTPAGTAQPTQQTVKFEAAGAGIKMTQDSVFADGRKSHSTYTANYDGKDVPIAGGPAHGNDTAALTRVDANTTRTVFKKSGKVTRTLTSVVSADGKTRTNTAKSTDAKGVTTTEVNVYDKQ